MKISIVCKYPIPVGMAATTRIMSYAKGLVEAGENVEVWSCIPTGNFGGYSTNSGIYEGVNYRYSYRRARSQYKLIRALQHLFSLFIFAYKFHKINQKEKTDAVILSSDSIFLQFVVGFLCRINKIKSIFIFDEFPYPIRGKLKNDIPYLKKKAYGISLRLYDGYISMTQTLLDYYQDICKRPGLIVSTITDLTRFSYSEKDKFEVSEPISLVYMGNMELTKDNVDNIVRSLPYVLDEFEVHLYLYGRPSKTDLAFLEKLIADLGVSPYVSFHYATPSEVSSILTCADILVSSQPDTKRAMGGFPTKLGEYLMSGTPVLLTDVGETSQYFIDEQDMFFAKPDSPIDFAHKIKYIKNNYKKAIEVAQSGRNKISTLYSHTKAGVDISNFINII